MRALPSLLIFQWALIGTTLLCQPVLGQTIGSFKKNPDSELNRFVSSSVYNEGKSKDGLHSRFHPWLLDDSTSRIFFYVGLSPFGISNKVANPWLGTGLVLGFAYGINHDWNAEVAYILCNLKRPEEFEDKRLGKVTLNIFSDLNFCINRTWRSNGFILGASAGVGINRIGIFKEDTLSRNVTSLATFGVMPRVRITFGRGNINYWGVFLQYSPLNFYGRNRLEGFGTRHLLSPGILIRANF